MKIAVLVSGGVDSAVALRLLHQEARHELVAFYLKIWLEDELSFLGSCPWEDDLHYVEAICKEINVPLKIISLQKEYHDTVVSYTIEQIRAGRTPNPDMMCNAMIKFGSFIDAIKGERFDKIASGHYAQIRKVNDFYQLYSSQDLFKDQTYFLAMLSNEQLAQVIFPIGHLKKTEVRAYAREFNLINYDRKDSQGICFLGKIKFKDFIKMHLGILPGKFIEYETGKDCGTHDGYWFYTIGQRQGIGLSGGPWYVVSKNYEKNQIFISRSYYDAEKKRSNFFVFNPHWIGGFKPFSGIFLQVKIRHGESYYQAQLLFEDNADHIKVLLSSSDQGIAPGQFVVFYDGLVCVGSGIIEINMAGHG